MRPSCSFCWVGFVRWGSRRPAAATMSAMCAPVPPEIAYTHTPGPFFPHFGGPPAGRVRASAADTSSSSSSPSTARDAELAEHGIGDRVGSGEVAGVALGHRAALVGAADLHHHDRLLEPRRVVGGEHERAAVLEALDVAGDHPHLGLVGEVAGEVGELEVDLVAGGCPVGEPHPELLALEHRPALVARLRDQRDRRALEVVAERLERVEVRVRAEQPHVARLHEVGEALLELLALLAGLGEAGGEDHRELRLALQHLLERVDGPAGEDDREVELARDVEDRLVDRVPEHGLVLGVHRVERRAVVGGPLRELAGHRGVGLARLLRRADHRDRLRVQEHVEVDVAQRERPPRDVDRQGVRTCRLPPERVYDENVRFLITG